MSNVFRPRAVGLLGAALLLLVLCGCSRADRHELDILPSTDKAQAALEKALTAWKNGEKMGKIQADSHSIEVADKVWMAGAKLTAFEILGPEDKPGPQPGPRWFLVKLTLKNSPPQQVHYAVLGLDPLWVYREEDYNQACGMGK
jgi:hypothetical protein